MADELDIEAARIRVEEPLGQRAGLRGRGFAARDREVELQRRIAGESRIGMLEHGPGFVFAIEPDQAHAKPRQRERIVRIAGKRRPPMTEGFRIPGLLAERDAQRDRDRRIRGPQCVRGLQMAERRRIIAGGIGDRDRDFQCRHFLRRELDRLVRRRDGLGVAARARERLRHREVAARPLRRQRERTLKRHDFVLGFPAARASIAPVT